MTPAEYLDAAKAELGIQADNELAKRFEVTRQRISAYRNWRSFLSRAALLVLIACTLASSFIATSGTEASPLGGILTASAAVFYALWVRIIWTYVSFSLSICENRL